MALVKTKRVKNKSLLKQHRGLNKLKKNLVWFSLFGFIITFFSIPKFSNWILNHYQIFIFLIFGLIIFLNYNLKQSKVLIFVLVIISLPITFVVNHYLEINQFFSFLIILVDYIIVYFLVFNSNKDRVASFKKISEFHAKESELESIRKELISLKEKHRQVIEGIEAIGFSYDILRSKFSNILDRKSLVKHIEASSIIDTVSKDDSKKESLTHISNFVQNKTTTILNELKDYNIKQNGFPVDRNTSFKYVVSGYAKLSNTPGSFAWFVNLIEPKIWFKDIDWYNGYIKRLLEVSKEKKKCDIRRMHILLRDDYTKKTSGNYRKEINTMLFKEQFVGINNKLLLLTKANLRVLPRNTGVTIEKTYLLDYALFNSSSNSNYFDPSNRMIACSDVNPYFIKPNSSEDDVGAENIKVYDLRNHNSYGLFKENFLSLWNFNHFLEIKNVENSSRKYELLCFFDLIKNDFIDINSVDWEDLSHFIEQKSVDQIDEATKKLKDVFLEFKKTQKHTRDNFNTCFNDFIINDVHEIPL